MALQQLVVPGCFRVPVSPQAPTVRVGTQVGGGCGMFAAAPVDLPRELWEVCAPSWGGDNRVTPDWGVQLQSQGWDGFQ